MISEVVGKDPDDDAKAKLETLGGLLKILKDDSEPNPPDDLLRIGAQVSLLCRDIVAGAGADCAPHIPLEQKFSVPKGAGWAIDGERTTREIVMAELLGAIAKATHVKARASMADAYFLYLDRAPEAKASDVEAFLRVLPAKPEASMSMLEALDYGRSIKDLKGTKKPGGFPSQYILGKDLPIGPKLVAIGSLLTAAKNDETMKLLNTAQEDATALPKGNDWKCWLEKTQEMKSLSTVGDFAKYRILPNVGAAPK